MSTNTKLDVFKRIDMHGGDRTVCWEWTLSLHKGRPYFVYVDDEGVKHKELAYRVTYELMTGTSLTPEQMILHQCDNSACCNPYLGHACKIGTHQDNMNDMKNRERHGLPHDIVKIIKRLLATNKLTHNEIAYIVDRSRQLVTEVARDKVYQHVEIDDAKDGQGTRLQDQAEDGK